MSGVWLQDQAAWWDKDAITNRMGKMLPCCRFRQTCSSECEEGIRACDRASRHNMEGFFLQLMDFWV